MLLIRLKFPLHCVKESNCMRKIKYENIFSSTGRRPVELMRYPIFRHPAVRPASVRNKKETKIGVRVIAPYCHVGSR